MAVANRPVVEAELYFLIARFLANGPCESATRALIEEVGKYELLPKRYDWLGNEHPRSFDDLARSWPHISHNHLLKICTRLGPLLDRDVQPNVTGVNSLLAGGRQSLLRTKDDLNKTSVPLPALTARLHGQPLLPPINLTKHPNITQLLATREQSGPIMAPQMIPTKFYKSMQLCCRRLGHLSSVYCLLFDRTGRYIFTGADDLLVKVWSASDGRLVSAFRGHSAEITDMAVNYENTLLAAGSCDKIIRVWCLRTAAPLAVLTGHTAMITSLKFCPCPRGTDRYLVSTGNDGCIYFWQWDVDTSVFNPQPRRFTERNRPGAQLVASSFSSGGTFVATGSTDHHVRIYNVYSQNGPERILEMEAHSDRVDSIQFANHSERFVSGSRDGTANIWRFERQNWRKIPLRMSTRKAGEPALEADDSRITKLKVTMVGWDADDKFVITAVNDFSIKVWNSNTGDLVYQLQGHEDEVFVLEPHPTDPRVLLSAGHDGRIILWDLTNGTVIKNYFNVIEGQGHGAVFDCKFSPDGRTFAFTDSHGHICIFGFGSNEKYRKIPDELFFHTDYRPLIRDANHHVLDEQTQQAPHVMPPPFLVNIDGNPYPPELQRLVPGRENASASQLVPHVVASAAGDGTGGQIVEVLAPVLAPEEPRPASLVDQMVEQLQRNRAGSSSDAAAAAGSSSVATPVAGGSGDAAGTSEAQEEFAVPSLSGAVAGGDRGALGPLSPRPIGARLTGANQVNSPSHGRVGMRRSGDVEGVRQSQGNWQSRVQPSQGELLAWSRRVMISDSDPAALRCFAERRLRLGELELAHFLREKKRRPDPPPHPPGGGSGKDKDKLRGGGRRKGKESKHQYKTRSIRTQALQGPYNENDFEHPDNINLSSSEQSSSEEEKAPSGSSSSDSESEYSDWTQDVGVNLQPPKRQQATKKTKPSSSSSSRFSRRVKTRENDGNDNDGDEMDRDERASREESTRASTRRALVRGQANAARRVDLLQVTEVAPDYKPSEWLTETVPHKTPYYPQMGDEVIYFRQGHKCYTDAVKRSKKFKILEKNQPWRKTNIRDQELVKVVGIRYEIHPPRLCCLKLAAIDPDTGKLLEQSFTIKYHDMPDVIDFLVLRQTYALAMNRNWKAGDRFRSMIDNAWWVGTIASQEPFETEYPDSMFQCFNVAWDNGEREKMSPWDLEPLDENLGMPPVVGGSTEVLPHELKAMLYQPAASEWMPDGLDAECERILRGLQQIMELSCAEPFVTPVDLSAYPSYAYIVEYPIDLAIIRARLQNRFYRRITSVQFDVRFIETNAKKFNEQGSRIVKQAHILTELCLRLIEDGSIVDVLPVYQEIAGSAAVQAAFMSDTSDSSDSDDAMSSDDDEEEVTRSARSSHQQQSASSRRKKVKRAPDTFNSNSWKHSCRDFMDMLTQCEDAEPFRVPVDPALYPDYQSIIDHPMDFRTVREKLDAESYESPVDLCRDCRLVFVNSRNYNINKKSRIYSMTIRMSAFFEEQIRVIISDWKSAVKYEQKVQNNHFVSDRRRPLPPQNITELVPTTNCRGGPFRSGQHSHTSRPNSREDLPYVPGASCSSGHQRRGGRPVTKRRRLSSDHAQSRPTANGRRSNNSNTPTKRKSATPAATASASSIASSQTQLTNGALRRAARTKTKPRRFIQSDDEEFNRSVEFDAEKTRRTGSKSTTTTPTKKSASAGGQQRNGRRRKTSEDDNNAAARSSDDESDKLVVDEGSDDDGSTSKSQSAKSKSDGGGGGGGDKKSGASSDTSSSNSESDSDGTSRRRKKPPKTRRGSSEEENDSQEEDEDEEDSDSSANTRRRSTRTTTRNSSRATRSVVHERSSGSVSRRAASSNKRRVDESDRDENNSGEEEDEGASSGSDKRRSRRIATRKRVKPVRYREDSEFEYDFNSDESDDGGPGVIKLVRHSKRGGGVGAASNRKRSTALGRSFVKS